MNALFPEKGWLLFAFLEGYAGHEGINPRLSMTHAFTFKFVSHQEQLDVSRMQYMFF